MYRAIRFCKRLSAEERNRLKGTAVENCDKDLFAIADIGDIQQRTSVISALSDADKPAPSLYEAKCRAGLAPHLEPDLEREFERGANRLFDSLFYGRTGTWERFLRKVAADEPDFLDTMTEVVKRLTERGGESCAYLLPKERERSRAVPATRASPSNRGRNYEQHQE